MLPKNSYSRTYLKKVAKKEKIAAEKAKCIAISEKTRVAEDRALAAEQIARKEAEKVVRKSGARTLDEQESVKKAFAQKKERTISEDEYTRMVAVCNTNRRCDGSKAAGSFGNNSYEHVGNKRLGKIKAEEISKRWGSSLLD